MMKTSFVYAALAVFAQAQTTTTFDTSLATGVTAGTSTVPSTCIQKGKNSFGLTTLGTAFTDYNYLMKNEASDFVYRLNGIQLCVSDPDS